MTSRAISVVLLLAIVIASGTLWERVERRREAARFPQVGRSVDIGGRSLNLYCSGEGSPAVIFESDALRPGYSWTYIQRRVAWFTRACWYDRAGYGWSAPAPAPRTSTASARDLHALLRAAGVPAPYVIAVEGFGAYNTRVFASLYRDEMAGVVLSDAPHEDEFKHFPEEQGHAGKIPFHLGFPPDLAIRTLSSVGLMRVMVRRNGRDVPSEGLTAQEQATLTGLQSQPKVRAAFLAEQGFNTGPEEVRGLHRLGDLPLIVLDSDPPVESARQIAKRQVKLQLQEELARLSTRGKLQLISQSRGDIQCEAPEAIVAAVRQVVDAVRK